MEMLFEHLGNLRRDDLLVLNRGYPARWLVAVLFARGLHVCIRVDDTGFTEVARFRRSGAAEAVVTLAPPSATDAKDYGCPRTSTQVRLVRVITPTGRVRILMTSLLNPIDYPAADFGDLYHAPWRIEHRLALEHLTGISWLAAQEDFGAKILADNLQALSVYCAAQDPAAIHFPKPGNPRDRQAPLQTQQSLCLRCDQKPDAALAALGTRHPRRHRKAVHRTDAEPHRLRARGFKAQEHGPETA